MSENAFPFKVDWHPDHEFYHGLSKKEYFIAKCLQGLLSNPAIIADTYDLQNKTDVITTRSIEYSNSIMEKLGYK